MFGTALQMPLLSFENVRLYDQRLRFKWFCWPIKQSVFCKQEEEIEEDPERLGLHVDDRLNVAEADGRIIVNIFFFMMQ